MRPPHPAIENEAGAAEEKTTSQGEHNQRDKPGAGLSTKGKIFETEREGTTARASNYTEIKRKERMLRETGAEGGKESNT